MISPLKGKSDTKLHPLDLLFVQLRLFHDILEYQSDSVPLTASSFAYTSMAYSPPFPEPLHLGQGPGVGRDSAGGVPLCLCGHDLVDPFPFGIGSHQARRTEWLNVAGRR